ncbi:hypothetical protein DFH09DRAFT_1270999 [Mycena vulgaris]|nr:hypothetical protein DFH09DRAFT_1270999 [Mycena vulgaris]
MDEETNLDNAGKILTTWFHRAIGRPLSLTIDCDYSVDMPPAIFTSISTFQNQLVRLELCLSLPDFQKLERVGPSFRRLQHLAISLLLEKADGVSTAFQDTPALRELCLGSGISLHNVDATILPLLTMLELSEPISVRGIARLVQRFPKLEHLKAYRKDRKLKHPVEPQTILQLRSLDVGSGFFDHLKVPNLQNLVYSLPIRDDSSLHSLISRSACFLQHLTLSIASYESSERLASCLHSVPTLTTLLVKTSERPERIFECLTPASILPCLRMLTVHTHANVNGSFNNYESVILMMSSCCDTPLRTVRLRLECDPEDYTESFEDGAWLPGPVFRAALEPLRAKLYVGTPGWGLA